VNQGGGARQGSARIQAEAEPESASLEGEGILGSERRDHLKTVFQSGMCLNARRTKRIGGEQGTQGKWGKSKVPARKSRPANIWMNENHAGGGRGGNFLYELDYEKSLSGERACRTR